MRTHREHFVTALASSQLRRPLAGDRSEEIGSSGELLGNVPQAFTRLPLTGAKNLLVERTSDRRCPSCDRLQRAGEACGCSPSKRRRSKAL